MLEDDLGRARVAHALDHARMVELVGEDDAAGELARERGHCRRRNRASERLTPEGAGRGRRTRLVVRDVAAAEDERRGLLVQRGELGLEGEVDRSVAGNVARAAGAGAVRVESVAAKDARGN